ncbi:hypothetical protein, partial [Crocosphaera watsonii]|uniref:hypothetical protein n=1 Tax=Crocosphaera watsonii TaxID=263511 RepID=UPI00065FA343
GYGWFVDLTPLNNEEFIENGLNLVALENSSAVNKIDLVTVIAHEMGHLLNLPDFDYRDTSIMGGLLSPGMRKLGISEEIQNLLTIDSEFSIVDNLEDASEEKSLDSYNITSESLLSDVILPITGSYEVTQINKPHLFTSFLQINSTNTTNITNNSLLNGDFNITEQTEPNFGWNIEGNASIINEAMNLNEDSTVNTRLSQTFNIPQGTQNLQFTILNANLNQDEFTPPDTFEVALLNTEDMTSLVNPITGLTNTDSLFNLQSNGQVFFSPQVMVQGATNSGETLSLNSPITVNVDVSNIATNTAATLYFDLLGFGDEDASIILDNISLSSDSSNLPPSANNDTVTTDEDTAIIINIL